MTFDKTLKRIDAQLLELKRQRDLYLKEHGDKHIAQLFKVVEDCFPNTYQLTYLSDTFDLLYSLNNDRFEKTFKMYPSQCNPDAQAKTIKRLKKITTLFDIESEVLLNKLANVLSGDYLDIIQITTPANNISADIRINKTKLLLEISDSYKMNNGQVAVKSKNNLHLEADTYTQLKEAFKMIVSHSQKRY